MTDLDALVSAVEAAEVEAEADAAPIGGALAWRQAWLGFVDRPTYAPLTLDAVRAAEGTADRTLVSTFSGCGGSSMGFRLAGFRVLWANEFIPAARETYLANFPTTPVDPRDVRLIQPAEILAATGLRPGELDVLEGSPPCAAFSMSGNREEDWGKVRKYSDTKQRVDDLFYEFVRLLQGLMPRMFVAENVTGLLRGIARTVFERIIDELTVSGYRVGVRVLDASWYGVPQSRQRVIFVGVREDLRAEPAFPEPLLYRYGVEDACPWLAAPGGACPPELFDGPDDAGPALPAERYATARAAAVLAPGETSERYFNLMRLRARGPAQTLLASHGKTGTACVIAPWEDRHLHVPEGRRLCGFPDRFVLTGTYAQRWERLGRAVPPQLMAAVAARILRMLEESR